ncbi:1-phosphofructokinase family hexose kinase [Spongiactinospora sp. TRM90649]|uniref:1-phosphofructokinase family hexose kinase n=1 Tax=Spongiactinospora sp. TRM90649 TaxID=3031114 RepID=UPI0023FA3584|nr:1-phosphofructokinase family hexose kinase [Spongiactinospora sp. TRM90649]MDF5751443.1 1-phosphofructokinase family hexose kinase [Spongiactinospora sp. TRM90649]
MTILTVTLNAALDVTYEVEGADWNGVNRVGAVHRRAGGKGVNVARVLAALGHPVLLTGLTGGPTGALIEADLTAAGLPHSFSPVHAASRTTLAVTSSTGTALFNESGPAVDATEVTAFLERYDRLLRTGAEAVVISGSLPPGLSADFYASLCSRAGEAGVPTIVDADGEPLRHAPGGRPAILKPNAEELTRAVGTMDAVAGARALRTAGAGAVVVSRGADGLVAVTPDGEWTARMPYPVAGNPTGAGDASVAGLALGLVQGTPWPTRLRTAAALGAAAVATHVAGDIDHQVFESIRDQIQITPH